MSLREMQSDMDVVQVQQSRIDWHPDFVYSAIYTQYGWKNVKTGEVTWEKVSIEPLERILGK